MARHGRLRAAIGLALLCLATSGPACAGDIGPLDTVPGKKSDTLELARAAAKATDRRARLAKQLAMQGADGKGTEASTTAVSDVELKTDAKVEPKAEPKVESKIGAKSVEARKPGLKVADEKSSGGKGGDVKVAVTKPASIEESKDGTMRIRPSADPQKAIDAIRERLQPRGVEPHVDADGNALLRVGSAEAKATGGSRLALAPVSMTASSARKPMPGIAHGDNGHAATSDPRRAPVKAGDKAHALHWSYDGEASPDQWARLSPEWASCANGKRQSPIDIHDGIKVDLESVRFEYRPSAFTVVDNGHTIQVNLPPGNAITVAGKRYELLQFHFHKPAEERVDGKPFDMVVHLVHKDANGKLAVVAVLLEKGSAQDVVQNVWNHLPLEKGEEVEAGVPLDPTALLPAERGYYTYMGSLTTPPCSEGVLWMVMKQPVGISADQLAIFARLYPMNARPASSRVGAPHQGIELTTRVRPFLFRPPCPSQTGCSAVCTMRCDELTLSFGR